MTVKTLSVQVLEELLTKFPRIPLAQLPTPLHPLKKFSKEFDDLEIWMKRDDLTGLAGGGNKTRKLEYVVADALNEGADMLVSCGAIQSNHTRQVAVVAAKAGMKCALMHYRWTEEAGPYYKKVGNILLSSLAGAEIYYDDKIRTLEDKGPLKEFTEYLREQGHTPYLIPGGASKHRLGSLGYLGCACEITKQSQNLGVSFDYVVHCTGSGSTQSGLVAGLTALGSGTQVIGIGDDDGIETKEERVFQLASDTLNMLELEAKVERTAAKVVSVDKNPYGVADAQTYDCIKKFARTEGIVVDPVYEGKAIRGLIKLAEKGYFRKGSRILLMHLGGTPAVHAYANHFGPIEIKTVRLKD